ncbi:hypothetical protein [Algoriphagus antarcticus]|uniref:Uncharacterized protein n=1 Tax=Algoriphagus antarcticus TaxID=238540 RepID=A0A3E0DD76_9BACT|nr:hypothetical protein [Algoriphagus antarcticus]REG79488.1 hypothetical protein C8N25_13136 [Algoriphagus antarcticus]
MAVVILGGLLTATLLNLIVIPCVLRTGSEKRRPSIRQLEQMPCGEAAGHFYFRMFAAQEDYPVFIVLGAGGKPSNPDELYILPIQELAKPILHTARLGRYRMKIDTDFFFDQEKKILR